MITCYRCGVLFDGTDFIEGAPCADCQYYAGEDYRKFNVVIVHEAERKERFFKQFYVKGYTDNRIAEVIGLDYRQVRTIREKLNLLGNKPMMTDETIAKLSASMTARNNADWNNPESGLRNRRKSGSVRRTGLLKAKSTSGWK